MENDHISRPHCHHCHHPERDSQGPEDDKTNRRMEDDAITTGSDDDQQYLDLRPFEPLNRQISVHASHLARRRVSLFVSGRPLSLPRSLRNPNPNRISVVLPLRFLPTATRTLQEKDLEESCGRSDG